MGGVMEQLKKPTRNGEHVSPQLGCTKYQRSAEEQGSALLQGVGGAAEGTQLRHLR